MQKSVLPLEMSTITKQSWSLIVGVTALSGVAGYAMFGLNARPAGAANHNDVTSLSSNSPGTIELIAIRPSSPPYGHCAYYHDGVIKQEPALLIIPGIVRSKHPVIVIWSRECTVRDQSAFRGFASKFGIETRHYIAPEEGTECLSLRDGDAFPSTKSESPTGRHNGTNYEAHLTSGKLIFSSGNTSLSTSELMDILRSAAQSGQAKNLDIYIDDNLPLTKLTQIVDSLSAVTKNLRFLRDNGIYSVPLYIGESKIKSRSRQNEAKK
jgi:hypothetical protein